MIWVEKKSPAKTPRLLWATKRAWKYLGVPLKNDLWKDSQWKYLIWCQTSQASALFYQRRVCLSGHVPSQGSFTQKRQAQLTRRFSYTHIRINNAHMRKLLKFPSFLFLLVSWWKTTEALSSGPYWLHQIVQTNCSRLWMIRRPQDFMQWGGKFSPLRQTQSEYRKGIGTVKWANEPWDISKINKAKLK